MEQTDITNMNAPNLSAITFGHLIQNPQLVMDTSLARFAVIKPCIHLFHSDRSGAKEIGVQGKGTSAFEMVLSPADEKAIGFTDGFLFIFCISRARAARQEHLSAAKCGRPHKKQ